MKPPSIRPMVIELIKKNGPMTSAQLYAHLGKYISSAQAMRGYERITRHSRKTGRRPSNKHLIDPVVVGARLAVTGHLHCMKQRGAIILKDGLYSLPPESDGK